MDDIENSDYPYQILKAKTADELERKVNYYINEGYFPKGGITVVPYAVGKQPFEVPKVTEYWYVQAIFKEPSGAHW